MADLEDEEARILATINKKQNAMFEQKRRDALKLSSSTAAKNFKLNEEEKKPVVKHAPVETNAQKHQIDVRSELKFEYSQDRGLTEEEKLRNERENSSHGDLNRYYDDQQRQEREFRKQREEEEKKKQEYIAGLSSSGLTKYQEAIDEREREFKRKLADEDKRKEEDIQKSSTALDAFKLKTAQEEREFRQRREEEERRKKDSLDAMATADKQRRESAIARDREEAEFAKQARAKAEKKPLCASCRSELTPDQSYQVKGLNYCFKCSVQAGAEKCHECGQPISTGTVMKVGAKKFHASCLKCDKCDKPLTGGYRVRRNKMVCVDCSAGL